MTAETAYRLILAEEFLDMELGPDKKAELDCGAIRMMAGGTRAHARIQGSIFGALLNKLRGSGCRPYGSDMAIRTDDYSVRFPDVSVICSDTARPEDDKKKSFESPTVIFEVLSPSTAAHDQDVKLKEYQTLASVETIVFVDPDTERCRIIQRIGPQGWRDERFADPVDVVLPALNIMLTHSEIFSRD